MIRFIIYAVIAYLLLRFVRRFLRTLPAYVSPDIDPRANDRKKNPSQGREYSSMVRCEICGMYVDQNRAFSVEERKFCSKACAEE